VPTGQVKLSNIVSAKPVAQQAIIYRIFNKAKIHDNKVDNDFFEKNKNYFRDYSLHLDDEVKQYVSHWKGDYNAWRKELTALKEEILNSILQEVKGIECLSSANAADLVELAKAMGALLAVDLKTSQIRRFLEAVMEAEVEAKRKGPDDFDKAKAEYLKVYLAYAAGRNEAAMSLLRILEPMISKIRPSGREGWDDFCTFVRFVRSIVAYHKFYGGGE
jgi:CRISPR-associated protein Csm2